MAFTLNYTHPIVDNLLNNIFGNIIDDFKNFYEEEVDFSGLGFLDPNNSNINTVSNYISAAVTLSQWWALNKVGNYTGPGSSQDNPYEVPLNDTQKCQILASLGSAADSRQLLDNYYDFTVFNPAVGNTYYQLNTNPAFGGIKWENDELVIYDVYNFEGIADFGAAPSMGHNKISLELLVDLLRAMVVAGATVLPSTGLAVVRKVMMQMGYNPNTGEFADGQPVTEVADSLPYTVFTREYIDQSIGNVANLYLENRFTKEKICECNPALYRDAVSKGYLKADATASGSCSNISQQAQCFDASDNVVPVGQAQPAPLLGLPYYTPRVMVIGSHPNSWNVGTNDRYPSPFTSFQQQITNNTHFLGPYAMWGPIAGRICLIVGGVSSGQKGFIAQCWDNFDDGNYNVDPDGIQYSSKKDWWDNTRKVEVIVPNLLFSGRPMTPVKVAVESFDGPGADNVWGPNWPIWSSPLGSVNLSYLIPLVTITSRYF